MKLLIIFTIMFFIILLSSCSKDPINIRESIVGKWNVISDSSYSGIGINNHAVNYKGQKGDYFDFKSDSNLYVSENGVFDTLHYQIISDTSLIIIPFGPNLNGVEEMSYINRISYHLLTIKAPIVYTPGGIFGRKVTLFR